MYNTILNAYTLMTPAKANDLASQLNAEDDLLTYEAVHDPKGTGQSFVKVIDEIGMEIGRI